MAKSKAHYERYKQNKSRAKNKVRKLTTYLRHNPNDVQARDYIEKLRASLH